MAIPSRLYHVPKRYEEYAQMSPTTVLNEMRKQLIDQYETIAEGGGGVGSGSAAEAKVLQNFFQQIKRMTAKDSAGADPADKFARSLMWKVISQAEAIGGYRQGREWFKMWGGQVQGVQFERELANIVASVVNMTGGSGVKGSQLMTGSGTLGSVNIGGAEKQGNLTDVLKPVIKEWITSADQNLRKMGQAISGKTNQLVTMAVSGKIDVTALTCDYTFIATGNAEFDRAAQLLKTATFTAKSYASLSKEWSDEYYEQLIRQSNRTELHLGSTSSKRIYIEMLMKYGDLPYPVAASFYYRTMHSRKSEETKKSLSQLRWIYELTGYGQTYVTQWFQNKIEQESGMGAKYLIYNDPATNNIYVRSTADLVKECMANFVHKLRGGTSVLEKSLFK